MPTILEITGTAYPEEYKGNKIHALVGKSMLPTLTNTSVDIHPQDGMGYELFEMKAYIKGNWKILRLPMPMGTGEWQLFDLAKDPGETTDLSAQHPEINEQLINLWMEYAKQNEVYDHKGHYDSLYRKNF
jgi:arylsulfatase